MENLESNVRKECKQAFAELQTTIEEQGTEEETGEGSKARIYLKHN